MNSIESLLHPYIELESTVRELMADLCSDMCGMCTACCCRVDICEEALESAFLSRLLKRQELDAKDLDDRYGWLDQGGCSLEYGRPPICYAYFCDQLLARLPDDDARLATQVLGQLLHHVGRNALGDLHLVEIRNSDDLKKVDYDAIEERMNDAQAALGAIEEWIETGRLGKTEREILAVIPIEEL